MPVFEPKTSEPITNGELPSQPEPEPVTKEGKTYGHYLEIQARAVTELFSHILRYFGSTPKRSARILFFRVCLCHIEFQTRNNLVGFWVK